MNQKRTPSSARQRPVPPASVPPLRSLHHFACTGGTLLSKCIAVAEDVLLLSEIDPLSPLALPGPDAVPGFRPTDLIYAIQAGPRPLPDRALERIFLGGLRQLRAVAAERGLALVVRDHAHSQYCTGADPAARPTMRRMLERTGPVLPVVSVRHPLDSFLSLDANDWRHFQPFTLADYVRRYALFLDDHATVPVVRHEDFLRRPATIMRRICRIFDLPYDKTLVRRRDTIRLSGDSGRSATTLKRHPRRPIPDGVAAMLDGTRPGDGYHDLCARLGYDADPAAPPLPQAS